MTDDNKDKRIGSEIESIWPKKPFEKRRVTIEDVDPKTGLLKIRSGDDVEEVSHLLTNVRIPKE